jgi:hypothetical protein
MLAEEAGAAVRAAENDLTKSRRKAEKLEDRRNEQLSNREANKNRCELARRHGGPQWCGMNETGFESGVNNVVNHNFVLFKRRQQVDRSESIHDNRSE